MALTPPVPTAACGTPHRSRIANSGLVRAGAIRLPDDPEPHRSDHHRFGRRVPGCRDGRRDCDATRELIGHRYRCCRSSRPRHPVCDGIRGDRTAALPIDGLSRASSRSPATCSVMKAGRCVLGRAFVRASQCIPRSLLRTTRAHIGDVYRADRPEREDAPLRSTGFITGSCSARSSFATYAPTASHRSPVPRRAA